MKIQSPKTWWDSKIVISVLLSAAAYTLYECRMAEGAITGFLIASVVCMGMYFWPLRQQQAGGRWLDRSDLWTLAGLTLICSPFYLADVFGPYLNVHRDELLTVFVQSHLVTRPVFPLGLLSDFYDRYPLRPTAPGFLYHWPALIFYVEGWIARVFGTITLAHVRDAIEWIGLATVGMTYVFCRAFKSKGFSAAVALLFGMSPVFIGLSHLAVINNSVVLIEMAALGLLIRGRLHSCPFLSFLGGLIMGLCFYAYFPARLTVVMWALFELVAWRWLLRVGNKRVAIRPIAATAIGFALIVIPFLIASARVWPRSMDYVSYQVLLTPQGRAPNPRLGATTKEVVLGNIRRGLTAFNLPIPDYSGFYYNNGVRGFGIVDFLSGLLLWLGLFLILRRAAKRTVQDGDLLIATAFLALYGTFAFFVSRAPSYTRLLVILPFVYYLAATALWAMADWSQRLMQFLSASERRRWRRVLLGLVIGTIVQSDFVMLRRMVKQVFSHPSDIGAVLQEVQRTNSQPFHYYVATSSQYPYFMWGDEDPWQAFLPQIVGSEKQLHPIEPKDVLKANLEIPFLLFMPLRQWSETRPQWQARFPALVIRPAGYRSDKPLIVLEVHG